MKKTVYLIGFVCLSVLAACSTNSQPSINVPVTSGNVGSQSNSRPSPNISGQSSGSGRPASPNPGTSFGTPSSESTPQPFPTAQPGQTGSTHLPELKPNPYRDTFFTNYGTNPFVETGTDPLSTFALDVDTGSYSLGRSELMANRMPSKDSVRTEEYLNAFNYRYPQPVGQVLAIHTELAPSYFGEGETRMLRIGIQGKEVLDRQRLDSNLTFVVDVSGSMNRDDRLELVKKSLRQLVSQLRPGDSVGLVIYGTEARVALAHTSANHSAAILSAIDSLRPEGSTNAEAGLALAYQEASKQFRQGAINRVILCSDGVANVGATGPDAILSKIKQQSESGITLTTLGFGMGEYNDTLMEQLANQGDGTYAYIDTFAEAQKVLGSDLTSTLQTIAKDAKIQVSFNKETVEQYRLLGYENRNIADKDFRNDAIDAGEIGANHSVTALYEVRVKAGVTAGELATVSLRYQDVANYNRIQELSKPVALADETSFRNASPSFKLATAVAEYAEIMRGSVFARDGKLSEVASLAQTAQSELSSHTQLNEFVTLVAKASQIQSPLRVQSQTELISSSQNPQSLPDWHQYLLRQLGGGAIK